MKRLAVVGTLSAVALLTATACGTSSPQPATPPSNSTSTSSSNATASNSSSTSATPTTANLTMKVVTGKMDGKKGWPKFEPADSTLPANAVVTVTIQNYDDGNAPIPQGDNKVTGTTDGTMTVDGKSDTSVPTANVAHTFTISSIGLNVPIPVRSANEKFNTVQFTFKTPSSPTKLDWQCMAACGTGSSGWMGSMATDGWMKGVLTIQ